MKRTKEARMDLDREKSVQGADESRIFYDKYKRGNVGHPLQTKTLYFYLLPQLQQYIIPLKEIIKE